MNTNRTNELARKISRWLLLGLFAVIAGPPLLVAFLGLLVVVCCCLLALVLWIGMSIAPYADVLLVQVLVPLVIAVVFAPEPTKRLLPRLPGKRRARS